MIRHNKRSSSLTFSCFQISSAMHRSQYTPAPESQGWVFRSICELVKYYHHGRSHGRSIYTTETGKSYTLIFFILSGAMCSVMLCSLFSNVFFLFNQNVLQSFLCQFTSCSFLSPRAALFRHGLRPHSNYLWLTFLWHLHFLFLFWKYWFELRGLCLLGRYSSTWSLFALDIFL
jgi:hypothetical protein